jgi:hypothetical protein
VVKAFRFGGNFGVQPLFGPVPTSQVSFLRGPEDLLYDATRPIFQATIPKEAPGLTSNYTALSSVVNVDVTDPAAIMADNQLFDRQPNGQISRTLAPVLAHQVTPTTLVLQLQFEEGGL